MWRMASLILNTLETERFLNKIIHFQFNSHFSVKTTENIRKAQEISFVHHIIGFFQTFYTLRMFLKMWRMHTFIRYKCGERKNIAGEILQFGFLFKYLYIHLKVT